MVRTVVSAGVGLVVLACEPPATLCDGLVAEPGVLCIRPADTQRFGHGLTPEVLEIADIDGDGQADIVAGNPHGYTISVTWGPDFMHATSWSLGTRSGGLAVADFDGDGRLDVACSLPATDRVAVFANSGQRKFSGRTISVRRSPRALAAIDFDGTGTAALVVASVADEHLEVIRGDVVGPALHVPGGPQAFAVGDFDGDGRPDLSVALGNTDEVAVVGRSGDGLAVLGRFPVGTSPRSLAIADFDHDGHDDIASASELDDEITVLWGDGAGGVRKTESLPASGVQALAVVASPQMPSLVALTIGGRHLLQVWPVLGDSSPQFLEIAGTALAVAGPDSPLNGHGFVADASGEMVTVQYPTASPPTQSIADGPLPGLGGAMPGVFGDFDGDGTRDWFGAARGIAAGRGAPEGFGWVVQHRALATLLESDIAFMHRTEVGDLDGDGRDDVVLLGAVDNPAINLVAIVRVDDILGPAPTATTITRLSVPDAVAPGDIDLYVRDFDGDAVPDILLVERGPNDRYIRVGRMLGSGDGSFGELRTQMQADLAAIFGPTRLVDIHGDGRFDLFIPTSTGLWVARGQTGAGFDAPTQWPTRAYFRDLVARDLTGNGTVDMAMLIPPSLVVLPAIDPYVPLLVLADENLQVVTAADLDGDGLPELVAAGERTQDLQRIYVARVAAPNPHSGRHIVRHYDVPGAGSPRRIFVDELGHRGQQDLVISADFGHTRIQRVP